MAKKNSKKKIISHRNNLLTSENYLLGSSADTSTSDLHFSPSSSTHYSPMENRKSTLSHTDHLHSSDIRGKQAFSYAKLTDDIAEEAALISSSEGGYDAEFEVEDDRFQKRLDSSSTVADMDDASALVDSNYIQMNVNAEEQPQYGNYQDRDDNSVFSEVSDSLLLLEERQTYPTLKWHMRPSVFMISALLFLYTFSLGYSMSADLQLVMKGICYIVTEGKLDDCSSNLVQQKNASLQKWTTFFSSSVQVIVAVKMGKMSDLYGRKPLIIFNFLMATISRCLTTVVLLPQYFSLKRKIGCTVVGALGGSVFVLLGLANSYVIDVVHEGERLQAMGKITGALFLGLSLGPLVSSFLSSAFGLSSMNILTTSAVMMIISLVLVCFVLPESRSVKLRDKTRRYSVRSQKEIEASPSLAYTLGLSAFADALSSLRLLWITRPVNYKPRSSSSDVTAPISTDEDNDFSLPQNVGKIDKRARVNGVLLLTIEILITMCSVGANVPVALYLIYTFNFSQSQLGLFVGCASGMRALVLTVLNPWLQHYFMDTFTHNHLNVDFIDVSNIALAIACELIAATILSFSVSSVAVAFYVVFASFSAIGSPVIHSAILKYNTSPGKNGEFFGALALIRNILDLVAPLFFLSVYSYGVGIDKPYIIFYCIIALFSLAGILLGYLRFPNSF